MNDLYREELMDIYKNPVHRGSLKNATFSINGKNPMCGDEICLQLKVSKGKIVDAMFSGEACVVSTISSEILTDYIVGKTVSEVKKIDKDLLLKKIGLNLTTSRIKCATLVLNALQNSFESL